MQTGKSGFGICNRHWAKADAHGAGAGAGLGARSAAGAAADASDARPESVTVVVVACVQSGELCQRHVAQLGRMSTAFGGGVLRGAANIIETLSTAECVADAGDPSTNAS